MDPLLDLFPDDESESSFEVPSGIGLGDGLNPIPDLRSDDLSGIDVDSSLDPAARVCFDSNHVSCVIFISFPGNLDDDENWVYIDERFDMLRDYLESKPDCEVYGNEAVMVSSNFDNARMQYVSPENRAMVETYSFGTLSCLFLHPR
jgi:hypothetical protein